jgi:hypothetical protein
MKVVIAVLLGAHLMLAQWPVKVPADAPRTADGKINLAGPAPKMADGKPDLSGTWENGAPAGTGGFGAPPGRGFLDLRPAVPGGIPMKPEAAALRARRAGDNSKDHPDAHCLPIHPVQLHSHPQPRKIVQTPGLVVILYEANNGLRQIFTDGRALPPTTGTNAVQPMWYGYSIGRWENDTLVVTTRGFREEGWLDEQGTPGSDALILTERFRRPSYGALEIDVTVDDPKMMEKPFTFPVRQRLMADGDLIEFICLENQKIEHLVGR